MWIESFQLERWQSIHEHHVQINLSDSGIHPVSVSELEFEAAEVASLLDHRLIYTQTNGTPELRRAIASLYPDAEPDNVEVVNGGAEANFIALWSILERDDEVVAMLPNYMQVPGLVGALGGVIKPWWMRADVAEGRWTIDLDELGSLVTDRTRLIAICNPNNPTGACLSAEELDEVGRIADTQGAWVLSDEIYQGSELEAGATATMWGRTEKPVVTNSLSKTYGLPGLRLGWVVSSSDACADFWRHHDYTTIGPGALSDAIATRVLQSGLRDRLLVRTREHLRSNYAVASALLEQHSQSLSYIPPVAGAMLYIKYADERPSVELAQHLLEEKSVLVVPGNHYDMEGWIRVGFGGDQRQLRAGLERVSEVFSDHTQ